jgi:hypothetical protein
MFVSKIKSKYIKPRKIRFCQGDILKDIHIIMGISNGAEDEEIMYKHNLPYCVVMNQDCDLDLDVLEREKGKTQDKNLLSILLCPAYQDEEFYRGDHLSASKWKMREMTADKEREKIKKGSLDRYHYLEGDSELQVPNLVLDFKHFFTVSRDLLYKQKKRIYLVTINELFRERLSQRFANYLSRFGLPSIKKE